MGLLLTPTPVVRDVLNILCGRQRRACALVALLITWMHTLAPLTRHVHGTGIRLAQLTNQKHAAACATHHEDRGIPKRLISVAKTDALTPNVERTRSVHADVPFRLYTDDNCTQLLQAQRRHVLLHAFQHETYGPFKSDICRAAVLYHEGGFYLDNDLVPDVNLIRMASKTGASFVGMIELSNGGASNAFLGAMPGHGILRTQLELMTAYYRKAFTHPHETGALRYKDALLSYRLKETLTGSTTLVGPHTLGRAVSSSAADESVYVFAETRLPFWKAHDATWQRWFASILCSDCSVVGVDPASGNKLFYTRNLGSRGCPELWRSAFAFDLQWVLTTIVLFVAWKCCGSALATRFLS